MAVSREELAVPDQPIWDRLRERPVETIPFGAGAGSLTLSPYACILVGWSIRETAGAAASARLRHGQGVGGEIIYSIGLLANADQQAPATDPGVLCEGGIYLERVAGSTEGAIHVRV